MIRAKTELFAALAAALTLVVFLAWYEGQRNARAPEPVVSVTDENLPQPSAVASVLPIVADTTVLAGPLPGVAHEPPAPEVESDVLERDLAYIAEAFPALSTWSLDEVKPLLATAALNASTDAELAEIMSTLGARLGDLQYFDQPQPVEGAETIDYAATSAELQPYRFTAWYEAGAAEVNLVLERQQDYNAVYSFDIHIPDR
ncbi:MAG: hypothetical protein SV422_14685 [Pseudomonadota bacterium]|nr:hypothetical protein [Pseudomonadota bacterium]